MIEELKKIVTEEKDAIRRQYKAEIKAVFGSYARGDFHADSDLDLLVDVDVGATLLDLVGLQHFLEDRLGCKVDVVTRRSVDRVEAMENLCPCHVRKSIDKVWVALYKRLALVCEACEAA